MTLPTRAQSKFDASGPEGAPAIVLVHGSVVTRKMWLPQLRGLAESHRVIAPDLPGHGARAHEPFSFEAAQESLADLIRREAHGRALVAGLSLGGYIAIELAYRHPEVVSGLVLSGCSVSTGGAMALYLRLISWLMRRGWIRQTRAQAEAKTRRMFPAGLADVAEEQMKDGVFPDPLAATFAEMAAIDFKSHLAAYSGPVLFLNGERDAMSRKGEAEFLRAAQSGRAQIVPGAGHACNLDQPEAYNRAVMEFAQSIRRA